MASAKVTETGKILVKVPNKVNESEVKRNIDVNFFWEILLRRGKKTHA